VYCCKPKYIWRLSRGVALLWMIGSAFPYSAGQQRAPDFSRSDLEHRPVSLSAYLGKVVLLNFWATWCAPCRDEIPRFRAWQLQNGERGLQVVGISMDDEGAPVRTFYREYRLNYPVLMGDESLGELYGGVFGLPVTFLIDRKGRIRYQHQGETNLNLMQREIEQLLKEH
jgi:cytochrome c biogenesis protein CcmG, thiol:disulfide interchange protein DsbE